MRKRVINGPSIWPSGYRAAQGRQRFVCVFKNARGLGFLGVTIFSLLQCSQLYFLQIGNSAFFSEIVSEMVGQYIPLNGVAL